MYISQSFIEIMNNVYGQFLLTDPDVTYMCPYPSGTKRGVLIVTNYKLYFKSVENVGKEIFN